MNTQVLIETFKDGYAEGYTPEYIRAKIRTEDGSLKGKTVTVRAVSSVENSIICEFPESN